MKEVKHMRLFRLSPTGILCAMIAAPFSLVAQTIDEEADNSQIDIMQEIVVTGRKREETLQEIPVSISVLTGSTLAEQNVLSQGDLAELVPGLTYNQGNGNIDDRIAALPSIRGISSNEIATNRTKVSSFIDGIPILGSVGSINIGGASQVEVYSGPQSAAFGRSTFAGAINYVTTDPGDELNGSVGVNLSNEGTRIVSGSFGGPITDRIGFQLAGQYEDSEAPDDFYVYSDGVEADTRGGVNTSARFVFNPTDNFQAKLTFTHDETDDGPNSSFYATQQSSLDCYNSLSDLFEIVNMGMSTLTTAGVFDCEFERDPNAELLAVNDLTRYYTIDQDGQDEFDALVADAIANGADPDTAAADIALIQEAYSVNFEDVGSQSERDRVLGQFDFYTDNDSVIQLSLMKSKEDYIRSSTGYDSATPFLVTYTDGSYDYEGIDDMGLPEADPTTIDEEYVELRWASPGADRTRFVVGASYYSYEFITSIFRNGLYNSIQNGTVDEVMALLNDDAVSADPESILSEQTENIAAFFNVSYDFTDKITGSIEGRYASDDVGAVVPAFAGESRQEASQTTESFVPRLALNYNANENTTFYAQYSIGINPAGVNADLLDLDVAGSLENGFLLDIDGDGTDDQVAANADYELEDFLFYDEETLTNFEIGFKGTAFDDRLSYSGAIYHMIWEDALQSTGLDWDYEYATNDRDLVGTVVPDELLGIDDIGLGYIYTDTNDDHSANVTANQGTSETTGLELVANFRINENWSINGNTSIMNARYTDYCSDDIYDDPTTDLGGEIGADLDVSTNENGLDCYVLDGNKLANQPSFTLSLTPSYQTEFNNGLRLNATARFQYESTSYMNVQNVGKNASSQTLNLTLGLTKGPWSTNFYVNNVLGEEGTTGNSVQYDTYTNLYEDNDQDDSLRFGSDADDGFGTFSNFTYSIPSVRSFGVNASYNF